MRLQRYQSVRLRIALVVFSAALSHSVCVGQSAPELQLLANRAELDQFQVSVESEINKFSDGGEVNRKIETAAEYFVRGDEIRREIRQPTGERLIDIVSSNFYLSYSDTKFVDPPPVAELYPSDKAQQDVGNFTVADPRYAGLGPHTIEQFAQASCRGLIGAMPNRERTIEPIERDGVSCISVTYPGPHGSQINLIISPSESYALLEYESSARRDGTFYRERVELVNGQFRETMFPRKVTISHYKNDRLTATYVENISIKPIPADGDFFSLKSAGMPVGKPVYNFIAGEEQLWNGESLESVEGIVREAPIASRGSRFFLVGNIFLLVGVAFYLAVRKRSG